MIPPSIDTTQTQKRTGSASGTRSDKYDEQYNKAIELINNPETAEEGRTLIEKLAEAKHPDSMNYFGYLLANGESKDFEKAKELFTEGAKRGNSQSLYALGILHMSVGEKDEAKAIEYWEQAVKAGHGAAATSLGKCHEGGVGVQRNHEEALKYFKKAAQLKDPEGTFILSRYIFRDSKNNKEELRKGLRLMNESIKLGHIPAITALGELYVRGFLDDIPQDHKKAFQLFSKAAEYDDAVALFNLGVVYETETTLVEGSSEEVPIQPGQENKFGVIPDKTKSFEYYKASAERNFNDALYAMYQFYTEGVLVPKDNKVAIDYLYQAADQGSAKAAITLVELHGTEKFDGLVNLSDEDFKEYLSVAMVSNDPDEIGRAHV